MSLKKLLKPQNPDKMQIHAAPSTLFEPKKSMADIRKEMIILSAVGQQQKNATHVFNNNNDTQIQRLNQAVTTLNINEFKFLRKRSNNRLFQIDPNKCYCNRPRTDVWCVMCGYLTKGNVKVTCPQHPNNLREFDIFVCPNPKCSAPNHLKEEDLKLS